MSNFDTSNVIDMEWCLIKSAIICKSVDVSGFDTSVVVDVWAMVALICRILGKNWLNR